MFNERLGKLLMFERLCAFRCLPTLRPAGSSQEDRWVPSLAHQNSHPLQTVRISCLRGIVPSPGPIFSHAKIRKETKTKMAGENCEYPFATKCPEHAGTDNRRVCGVITRSLSGFSHVGVEETQGSEFSFTFRTGSSETLPATTIATNAVGTETGCETIHI